MTVGRSVEGVDGRISIKIPNIGKENKCQKKKHFMTHSNYINIKGTLENSAQERLPVGSHPHPIFIRPFGVEMLLIQALSPTVLATVKALQEDNQPKDLKPQRTSESEGERKEEEGQPKMKEKSGVMEDETVFLVPWFFSLMGQAGLSRCYRHCPSRRGEFSHKTGGHEFDPWSRKIPQTTGQLSPSAATTEACVHLEPVLHNKRSRCSKKPALRLESRPTRCNLRKPECSNKDSAQPVNKIT
ncbi:hypothetical protein JEQ12_006939 [Ovis aries]|uniref:Uncharacterized protein n=1 Tax=Ovis aries TaxID=9940 RepID=A0A836CVM7_SHEEP|nr:hypothetical protein JEQ12_006939 [Ovis aries]